jgi:hypothetical protein
MKRPAQPPPLQLNLSLLTVAATAVPADKHRELTLALVELLVSAAREDAAPHANGGDDEPETHR